MKIAVLVKQVPVSNDVSVDPDTHALVRGSSEGMINPADLNALEEAIALKEKTDGHVVVFTMGPPDAEKSLRNALAMGCDEACLITDRSLAGGDTIATSKVLAAALRAYGTFDLIMAGAMTADGATGQVGAMVAEYFSVPHITEIQSVLHDVEKKAEIEVIKKYQNEKARIKVSLPALLTVNFGCNEPRLPTLRTKRAANKKEVTVYTNAELKLAESEIGLQGSPTEVIDSFAPERIKKAEILTGSTEEITKQIAELIEKEKGNK